MKLHSQIDPTDQILHGPLISELVHNSLKFLENRNDHDDDHQLVEHIREGIHNYKFNFFTLPKAAEKALNQFNKLKKCTAKLFKSNAKRRLEGTGAHGFISKSLKAMTPAPRTCLKRTASCNGKAKGTLTTDPVEIDGILHHAWDRMTHGCAKDLHQTTVHFYNKYAPYMQRKRRKRGGRRGERGRREGGKKKQGRSGRRTRRGRRG